MSIIVGTARFETWDEAVLAQAETRCPRCNRQCKIHQVSGGFLLQCIAGHRHETLARPEEKETQG